MSSPDIVARMRLHGDVDARGMEHDFAVNVAGSQPEWLKAAMVEALEGIAAYPGAEELRRAEAAPLLILTKTLAIPKVAFWIRAK